MNKHNFYDALLGQDGHRIEHVRPPRDLQSWQQFPVSAIANFQPVIISILTEVELRKVLTTHPYRQFPVVQENKLQGVLTRDEMEKSFTDGRSVKLKPSTVCLREDTIGKLQQLLIESDTQFVVVLDRFEGQVVGLVTLHDLLRAQTMMSQRSKEDV
jgi:CIC family chloride channel protein